MSVSAAIEPAQAENVNEGHALAFRIAFAASVGFTLGQVLGWDFPFVPALFAVQLLTASKSLNLRQALGFVVLMVAGCVLSVLIAQIFLDTPLVLILVIALLIFYAFLMLAKGKALPVANVLLITVSVVPLVAVTSIELAYGLVYSLIAGSILAVLLVFLAYAFFPAREQANEVAKAPAEEERFPVGAALANAAALMSLVILFISSGSAVSVIIIMTAITILRQPPIAEQGAAYGFVMGNIAGGLAATVASLLVVLLPSPAFLLLVVLLFGLLFGAKIAEGGDLAPLYIVGLVTFLIVLGFGLAPLPGDSGSFFVTRVINVLIAAIYTIGVASVLRALFRSHRELEQSQ
ncbi:MAG TPA: DUF2955 domain-containing protein [Mesorhizobium sp.]|nr:DUF2955 domain-containing protein [Mesorhizobium sp.]